MAAVSSEALNICSITPLTMFAKRKYNNFSPLTMFRCSMARNTAKMASNGDPSHLKVAYELLFSHSSGTASTCFKKILKRYVLCGPFGILYKIRRVIALLMVSIPRAVSTRPFAEWGILDGQVRLRIAGRRSHVRSDIENIQAGVGVRRVLAPNQLRVF